MYGISVTDILPDVILNPLQHVFGDFVEEDDDLPASFELIGYESRNFIICTGSITILLLCNLIIILFSEVVFHAILLKLVFPTTNLCPSLHSKI